MKGLAASIYFTTCLDFQTGQIIYEKYAEKPVELTVENKSGSDCIVLVYEDYYNVFDADDEAIVVLKFFVGADDTTTVNAPKGTYGFRVVFGSDYELKDSASIYYALQTGKFSDVEGDYIAAKDVDFKAGEEVRLEVSLDDAAQSTEEIPYTYYVSTNHSWEKKYSNQRSGQTYKYEAIDFYGYTFYFRVPVAYNNGSAEPY